MNIATFKPVVGTAGAVGKNATAYSGALDFGENEGNTTILLSSTAGSITVTQQVSQDKIVWYDVVDASGNGKGEVATNMTVGTRYITVTPVLAPYARYKVVEQNVAATVATMAVFFQEK